MKSVIDTGNRKTTVFNHGAPFILGVTGGIGSGKSSVATALSWVSGAFMVSADAVCRTLLEPGAAGWQALRKEYGNSFLLADGSLNRPLLRRALFADDLLRRGIENLLHPLVRSTIARIVAGESPRGEEAARFVVEVPLLYEAGWEDDFAGIVVVYADDEQCRRRLMLRDRISEDEARQAIGTQMSLAAKAMLADHVIDNSGVWPDTMLQILHLRGLFRPSGGS